MLRVGCSDIEVQISELRALLTNEDRPESKET
jgi:hypothetical protein